jgi:hypothetical protein
MYVTNQSRPDLGGNIHHGDHLTFCPNVWRYLIDRYAISSMLDVGCGEGHAVKFFRRQGIVAHGIDGLMQNVARAVTPISHHDLTVSNFYMPVDLVWSCEVAEHIKPEFVHNFINTLSNGKIVAFSHALPGQPGYHHVNCQPPEYWIQHMTDIGYGLTPDTPHIQQIARTDNPYNHFGHGLVFQRLT